MRCQLFFLYYLYPEGSGLWWNTGCLEVCVGDPDRLSGTEKAETHRNTGTV